MAWKFENETPIYLQIMDKIKRDIASGVMKPGIKVKSVRDLAVEAGVNPNTMQKALQMLEAEGVLYSERTSERFVSDSVSTSIKDRMCDDVCKRFVTQMNELGFEDKEIISRLRDYLSSQKD